MKNLIFERNYATVSGGTYSNNIIIIIIFLRNFIQLFKQIY